MDNSGSILGVGDLIFDVTGDGRNSGEIRAGGDACLILAGSLWNTGTVLAQGSLLAELPGDIDNGGVLAGGADTELRLGGGLFNHASGQVLAGEDLTLEAGTLLENIGLLHGGTSLSADVADDVVNMGEMLGGAGLSINSGASVGNEGLLHSGGTAAVRAAADLSNAGDILSKGDLAVSAGGVFTNTGRVATESDADVRAGNLLNAGDLESGGSLMVDVAEVFENPGRVFSGETLEILAGSVRNLVSGLMMSMGDLWADAAAGLRNAGDMVTGGFLSVTTGADLRNEGGILAQSGIAVAASGHVDNPGTVHSGGGLSVSSGTSLFNSGEFQAVGDAAFGITRDLMNTGLLLSGGSCVVEAGGGLSNHGSVLSHSSMHIDAAGDVDNAGTVAGEGGLFLLSGAGLRNDVSGRLLSGGDLALSVEGDLFNQGLLEACGLGAVTAGGDFFNEGGRMLSQEGLAFDLAGAAANTGVLHSGAGLAFRSAGLENDGDILAQGDSWLTIAGNLLNTGFLFSGGAADLGVAGELHNDRGQILSVGDMRLGGTTLGSSMEGLLNEAGTAETLEGSMFIRARVVRNVNPDLVVTEGTEVVRLQGGRYSFFSDNWDQAQDLYEMLPSSSLVSSKRNAIIIIPAELQVLGLGLDRNAFPRAELDAAIAAAEARFATSGGTAQEIAIVTSLKNRLNNRNVQVAIQHFKDRSKVAAYVESVTRDTATGLENGATLAAAVDLEVLADSFENYTSTVSTASGDISIDAASFSNTGRELYEHRTIEWARGHANEHNSPRLAKEGGGVEVVDTPIGPAYGSITAGGSVVITADHVSNGISGNAGLPVGGAANVAYLRSVALLDAVGVSAAPAGQAPNVGGVAGNSGSQPSVIAPPRPEDLSPTLGNLDDLIGVIPANGLFAVNVAPGHRYLIETNPALTSMSAFYGSDYFLERLDVDISRTQQQLLGDAFYETRLVRDQILALTGRRLLSSEFTSDAEQLRALLDNAIAAHESLGLSVGLSLTAEQVAALDADIVWLEIRVVAGRDVLVPVVYLCSGSMETIARGGSVIYGRDVDIRASGDTANGGVIQALGQLSVSARNIFNSFGTMQGGNVELTATESLYNTSGLIKGGDVSISAGQDIISDTATTTFSQSETTRRTFAFRGPVLRDAPLFGPTTTTQTTSETANRRGSIEATGDLHMRAGRDIGVVGSDVRAGGDISMEAGRHVTNSAQELEAHSKGKTGSAKSRYDTLTSKSSTVEVGGSVDIRAGQDVVVHGSTVSAGNDAIVSAGNDVSVVAAQDGNDYSFKQKNKGGLFGKSTKESYIGATTTAVSSLVLAGERVIVEAGTGGAGDLALVGSRIEAGGDASLRAAGGIVIMPVRVLSYSKAESEESGFMGTGSSKLDERQSVLNVRGEIEADGKAEVRAGGDVAVQAARIAAGEDIEISAEDGRISLLTVKDAFYERHVESDTGYFSWSSSDKGKRDETVQHTEIHPGTSLQIVTADGLIVEYRETGNVREDIAQLAQSPGLAWMGELLQREDVDWQRVQEVHDAWKEEQGGVGGPGVMLVSLAVAVALTMTGVGSAFATWVTGINTTTGAAAARAATAGAATAGAAAGATAASLTATQLAIHSAVAAGFNSLVTQATVQLLGNQGDVRAALEGLVSMDTVRSMGTTMLTAGLLSGLMDVADLTSDPGLLTQAGDMTEVVNILSEELQRAALRGVVSAGVDTAINGGDLGQNLAYQMQAAGVAVLGSQGARAIGTAFKDQKIDTATKYIAHAALGGTMDLAMGGDGTSGALGAVAGELVADTYVNAWIAEKISQTEDYKKLSGDELRKELDKLEGEIAELRRRGVDLARLGAGMAAALTGGDINIAAQTGGNAAEHNALFVPVVLVVLAACEAVDAGIKLYNAYKLAEAIQDQDEAAIEYYGTEILIDTAVDAAPLGAVFTKLGMTKVGGIIMGLGAKVGDEAVEVAAKSGSEFFNSPIMITEKGMQHVIERHTINDIGKFAGKSKFNADEDVANLIKSATQQPMVKQVNGRYVRTFNVGREIGFDRMTGLQTSIMTVITEVDGTLVTAFPGTP